MESKWDTRRLGDCGTWYSGGTPRKSNPEYWSGNIPWISAKSLHDFFVCDSEDRVTEAAIGNGTRLLPVNSIIFIVRGMSLKTEFRMGITTRPVSFNQDLKAIVPSDDIDVNFLAYAIKAQTHQVMSLVEEAGHGTGVLPTELIKSLHLRVPPRTTQETIGGFFRSIDDKIELNRRMNETLESMARALFKSWFVDFDPVIDNALAAGNPIPEPLSARAETRRALGKQRQPLPTHIQKLFPDAFHFDAEMGWIPKGWQVQSPGEMGELLSGGTPKKSIDKYWNGNLPWISPKAMMTMHAFDSDEHVTEEAIGNGTRKVPKGTVLVMVRGMGLHQGVRISQARCDVTFNQDVKALVPANVHGDFLLFAMLDAASCLFGKVQASGHGTGVIPTDILLKLRFAVPRQDVLTSLTSSLTNINERIHAATTESLTLAKLRDTLLPKLLSGELRISEAEKLVASSL